MFSQWLQLETRRMRLNMSIDTDPRQQEAAPPRVLWSGHFRR